MQTGFESITRERDNNPLSFFVRQLKTARTVSDSKTLEPGGDSLLTICCIIIINLWSYQEEVILAPKVKLTRGLRDIEILSWRIKWLLRKSVPFAVVL
jgi:hypothetical protein